MTNNDYLFKAAIKKITEKLNKIFVDKIEEASNLAQDFPEKIVKELYNFKDSIIEEAIRMEKEIKTEEKNNDPEFYKNPSISSALESIQEINKQIDQFNNQLKN